MVYGEPKPVLLRNKSEAVTRNVDGKEIHGCWFQVKFKVDASQVLAAASLDPLTALCMTSFASRLQKFLEDCSSNTTPR